MGALAALLLPVGVLLGFATPAAAATHDVHTVKELADAFADAEDGDTVRIAADIVGENDSPDVEVPADIAVTLDLNRHSVTLIGTERGPSSLDPTNNPGIWVPPTSGLTIIATGGGTLDAQGSGNSAGIGGKFGIDEGAAGAMTIHGGTVTVKGSHNGAGIGGAYNGAGGEITITGGHVIAETASNGAGIGAGSNGRSAVIDITGGTVTASSSLRAGIGGDPKHGGSVSISIANATVNATGGSQGAGIGSGFSSSDALDITIHSGDVTAVAGESGAGIGGGRYSSVNTVTINGGTVTATGGRGAAGIGGGRGDLSSAGSGGTVAINGGTVNVTGGDGAAGIGGGRAGEDGIAGAGPDLTIAEGAYVTVATTGASVIGAGSGSTGASNFGSFTNAGELTIPAAYSLAIPTGNTVSNTGTIRNQGTLSTTGEIANAGTIVNTGTVDRPDNVTGHNTLVTFDGDGGTSPADVRVYGATFNAGEVPFPADPARSGHVFLGWVTDTGDPVLADTNLGADGPKTLALTAQWKALDHTVTFDAGDDGSAVPAVVVEHGQAVPEPAAPTREGYEFAGWFTDPDGTDEFDFTTPITGDLTLYAGWQINTYAVSFDTGDDGSVVPAVTVEHGELVTEPATPTREGYEFTGWFTDPEGTEEFDFATPITADLTLYAGWSVVTLTVTFDTGAGGLATPQPVNYGDTAIEPVDPTREGYTFTGWFTDPDGIDGYNFATPVTSDFTLHAGWQINTYAVSFDTGDNGSAVPAETVEHGQVVTEPAAPTREGYEFTGWFTDPEGTVEFDFTAPITADLTLYAGWRIHVHAVSFDARGGSSIADAMVEHREPVPDPGAPVRESYRFTGWFTDPDGTAEFDFTTPITDDLTLYAGWQINSYIVVFDTGGGTVVEPAEVAHGEVVTVPGEPTRSGYLFVGWFTDPDQTQPFDFTAPVTEDVTVYAGWQINSYTVAFDTGEGSSIAPVTVDHGQVVTAPGEPTREGYLFVGWFTDPDQTQPFDFTTPVTEDLTVYAGWQAVEALPALEVGESLPALGGELHTGALAAGLLAVITGLCILFVRRRDAIR